MCVLNQSLISFNYTTNASQPYSLYSFHIKAIATSITITCSPTDWYAFWLLKNVSLIEVKDEQTTNWECRFRNR